MAHYKSGNKNDETRKINAKIEKFWMMPLNKFIFDQIFSLWPD